MTILEKVRAKIIEAVPEIVELKQGCRVAFKAEYKFGVAMILSERERDFWCFTVGMPFEVQRHEIQEVYGRPITLADVLRAIEYYRKPNAFKLSIDTKGYMTFHNYKWEPLAQADWDFALSLDENIKENPELEELIGKALGI